MLKRELLVFVTTVAAACAAVNAHSDEAFEEAMRKCAAIEDTDARLTCFDAVASVAQPVATDAAPEAPTALTEPAATPKPAAPAAVAVPAAAGAASLADAESGAAEMNDAPQPLTDDVGKERVEPAQREKPEYAARVVRCERSQQSGQTYFYLDNDQVWKQANYRRMSLGDCNFDARLTKDAFGYELYIPEKDRTVRVSRIR